MTIKEKIGQKIMLDFRYWQEGNQANVKQDMVQLTATIKSIIKDNHIGGIILFANNLKNQRQIQKLADDLRELTPVGGIPLFIATDNEGGSVFRLPRGEFCSFPGNMALSAAVAGTGNKKLAYRQASVISRDLLALGINTNFAPVMDVNSNQDNPVINIRSFGDCPARVSQLAKETLAGMRSKNMVSVAKHFPGHGDTKTDSHVALPRVDKNRDDAHAIDLAPYRDAIAAGEAPDMIMTAHIQYPALDDSVMKNLRGDNIIRPATLSKKIQTDLLRGELGYQGVTITDALDMKAITDNFDIHVVMEEVFKAGVDIALMPIRIYRPEDTPKLEKMIDKLAEKITAKAIDANAVSASVQRILDLKRERNIMTAFPRPVYSNMTLSYALEKEIADNSITLLKNAAKLIPLKDKAQSIYILMPWREQSAAIHYTLHSNGYSSIKHGNFSDTNWCLQQACILKCDVLIIGNMSGGASSGEAPELAGPGAYDAGAVRRAIVFAKTQVKTKERKVIFLSLKSPYDVVNFDAAADAVLATYSFYGFDHIARRGRSLNATADVIIGNVPPRGKLPVDINNLHSRGYTATPRYPRGFGLTLNYPAQP
ncbi:glycoside hydrolase family 3 N-terminal domain-containing protein [Acerihabitans sp. KWT182]|uniref:beta-N-acetylhexosaminidase n=1 Tax=Acerihabitans sp. KWT182 TaxID=3157919 RepID=A0AAU7Q7C3_9GAMM